MPTLGFLFELRCVHKSEGVCFRSKLIDVIAGKFFIAYAPIESEKFLSMPKELARKYEEKFKYPERFYKSLDGIEAKPYKPVSKDMER